MTTVSVTERRGFKTCRGQWHKGSLNGMGLEPAMPNRNLLLGSLVHYTMADWISDRSLNPVNRFIEHWQVAENDIKGRYLTKFQDTMSDEELSLKYGVPVLELGVAMIGNYRDYYKGDPLPRGWTVIQPEQTMVIEVPGTEHPGPNGVTEFHKLEGTFDALASDTSGNIFIVDHKTYERKPSDTELSEDDQFLAYTWMVSQLGIGKVRGVMYNGLWKRGVPPKGRVPDDLFYRTLLPKGPEELANFGERIPIEINEMCNSPAIYLNPAWYSCPNCGFREVCMAERRGEDTEELLADYSPRTKSPAWRAA